MVYRRMYLNQLVVIETEAIDVERIIISINNSISTINSQNIGFWTYIVGLLAAVATIITGVRTVAAVGNKRDSVE